MNTKQKRMRQSTTTRKQTSEHKGKNACPNGRMFTALKTKWTRERMRETQRRNEAGKRDNKKAPTLFRLID